MPKGDNPNSRKNLRPPIQKGEVRNPKGRIPGPDRGTLLKKLLAATMKDGKGKALKNPITGEKLVSWAEGVDIALLRKAHAGNIDAIREIKDTIHGKIKDVQEIIRPDVTQKEVDDLSDQEADALYESTLKDKK